MSGAVGHGARARAVPDRPRHAVGALLGGPDQQLPNALDERCISGDVERLEPAAAPQPAIQVPRPAGDAASGPVPVNLPSVSSHAAGALVQVRRTLVPSGVKLPQSGTPSTKTVSTSSTPSTASSTDGGRTSRPAVSCASARCTSASCACRRATHPSVPPSGCQDQHGVDPSRDASALSSSVPERAPSARSSATSLGRGGSTMSSPGAPAATSAQKCCTSARCQSRSSADQPSQEGTGASAWTPVPPG